MLFGTDGIRGKANSDLTCEVAFRLGQALVKFKGRKVLVGKDTRVSGDMLTSALAAGINSCGGDVYTLGIVPTPAVAYLVREMEADAGVMISASHNPPQYNGLKVFSASGLKLSDSEEERIEAFILSEDCDLGEMPAGDEVGQVINSHKGESDYISKVVDSVVSQGITFSGLRIALDAGHGAAYNTSYEALRQLGADAVAINRDFSGKDINVNCGSTHLDQIKELVEDCGADIGIAHDGDADRVIMISRSGREIDGDIILALLAKDMKSRGLLKNNTVVGTVMSNLGLTRALEQEGIDFLAAKVGDRYVLEQMLRGDYNLGGEQSGHVILLDHNTTGDGLMSAVQFLCAVVKSNKTVDEAISFFSKYPQVMINVEVDDKQRAMQSEALKAEVERAERALGDRGRVLLRASGTEPVVRVMVEAKSEEDCETYAKKIADTLK